jgi:uncharacterized protein DUF3365
MRRHSWMLILLCITLAPVAAMAQSDDVKTRAENARAAAAEFGKRLIGELQKALAAGGPVAAIEVCNVEAPEIAAQVSTEKGMSVRRTSLKLRQPANKPDAWELRQLQSFEQRKSAGESAAAIEVGEFVESSGKRQFRYMKAIPTAELCLTCHGSAIAPEVSARLKALYPADAATGFKAGDLRGAFTITQE